MSREADLLDRLATLTQGLLEGRRDVVAEIYAEDALLVYGDGSTTDRAQLLDGIGSGDLKYHKLERDEVTVRLRGATGVICSLQDTEGQLRGTPFSSRSRVTSVWVLQREGWQLIAAQVTPLAR